MPRGHTPCHRSGPACAGARNATYWKMGLATVDFKVPAWELILRGSALYWLLFLIFRVVLRRDVGAVGIADVLFVVLVADASQNAMTGGYTSVAEGAVLVAMLIRWSLPL